MTRKTLLYSLAFVGCIVAANALTNRYGLIPVGFGLMATAGTFAAGLTFTIRDRIHDENRGLVLVLIATGAALSAFLAPSLAMASGVAFGVAELADFSVYEPLRRRRWNLAVGASALVGSVVDTVLFLWLAFGNVTASAVAGQVLVKLAVTLPAWLWLRTGR